MTGREYIDGNYIDELGYSEAEQGVIELVMDRFEMNNNRYTMGWFIDEPIYPANAELFDDFCDEIDFNIEELISWAIRYINGNNREYRIDTKWEDDCDTEVYYLRPRTEQEKEDFGY